MLFFIYVFSVCFAISSARFYLKLLRVFVSIAVLVVFRWCPAPTPARVYGRESRRLRTFLGEGGGGGL